jgi:hypothetical protein
MTRVKVLIEYRYIELDASMVVTWYSTIWFVVTPCTLVQVYRHFGVSFQFHLQGL